MNRVQRVASEPCSFNTQALAPLASVYFPRFACWSIVLLFSFLTVTTSSGQDQAVIVIVGAPGSAEYADQFSAWAEEWKQSAAHTKLTVIGTDTDDNHDKEKFQTAINELQATPDLGEVWLILIGHGTFDGKRAKFNLRGKDVTAEELATWLKPLNQRLIIINCASSSSPFINVLSGENRIVVTSTKDGFQYNFSRFGAYLASSINDPAIDLDKDGQTSLLEAFCSASQQVQQFYEQENRLATEQALIDDNGDAKGTPADWFDGVRATRNPKQGLADGLLANQVFFKRRGVDAKLTPLQRAKRDELEAQLEVLRGTKSELTDEQYLLSIEPILVELARLYDNAKD